MEIKGKVVIVTGASGGIGKAIAENLFQKGAKLVFAARSDDKIRALARKLPGSVGLHADMRVESDVRALVDSALKAHGRIDILVNNAGQGMYGPIESVDIGAYRKVMDLNVFAPLLAMELVIPHMRSGGGGMIVNVSSMVSKNAFPSLGAYASTKYALNALSFTARQELARDKIIVSVMHPRMTATQFGENAIGSRPSFGSRPNAAVPAVDAPEQVAEKVAELIRSEAAEATM